MRRRYAVNFFAVVLLIESHNPQNGRQDHSGAMDPSHGLVETDRTASLGSRHSGRTNGVVSGHEIQISRQSAESRVQITRGCTRVLASGVEGCSNGGNQWNGRNQAQTLMDLQHVSAFIEQGLALGIALGLRGGETKIFEGRFRLAAGGRIRQLGLGSSLLSLWSGL